MVVTKLREFLEEIEKAGCGDREVFARSDSVSDFGGKYTNVSKLTYSPKVKDNPVTLFTDKILTEVPLTINDRILFENTIK